MAKLRMQDTTANRNAVKDWINQAYAEAAVETQALQEAGTATLTSGTATYTLPVQIIEMKWIIAKAVNDSGFGYPLERMAIEQILDYRMAQSSPAVTGSTQAYALIGLNQLELWPTPTSADTLQFYYSYLPAALFATTDVPAFQEPWGSKILEYGALSQAAEQLGDPSGIFSWEPKYQQWMQRFQGHLNRRGGMVDQLQVMYNKYRVPHDNSVDVGR